MHPSRKFGVGACVGVISLLFISACAGISYPKYQGDAGKDTRGMTPFETEKIKTMLPSGWKSMPIPRSFDEETVAWLRSDYNGDIRIFCLGFWYKGREGISAGLLDDEGAGGNVALAMLIEKMPKYQLKKGTFSIDTRDREALVESYTGNITREGQEVPMVGYIAWRESVWGCKDGVFGMAPMKHESKFEYDLLSILRNWK